MTLPFQVIHHPRSETQQISRIRLFWWLTPEISFFSPTSTLLLWYNPKTATTDRPLLDSSVLGTKRAPIRENMYVKFMLCALGHFEIHYFILSVFAADFHSARSIGNLLNLSFDELFVNLCWKGSKTQMSGVLQWGCHWIRPIGSQDPIFCWN